MFVDVASDAEVVADRGDDDVERHVFVEELGDVVGIHAFVDVAFDVSAGWAVAPGGGLVGFGADSGGFGDEFAGFVYGFGGGAITDGLGVGDAGFEGDRLADGCREAGEGDDGVGAGLWGFFGGHLEPGERAEDAALREVREEAGLSDLALRGRIDTIDWYFRFRGCHFFLMETSQADTAPQRAEGITACRWLAFGEASECISYGNARQVLHSAHAMIADHPAPESSPSPETPAGQLDLALDQGVDREGDET